MKAYIQAGPDGLPHHFDCASAMYGARDAGVETRLVTFEEMLDMSESVTRNNLFAGSVEFMREVFTKAGKDPRVPANSNREEEFTTIGAARERIDSGEILFVKPRTIKLFTGMVVDRRFVSCLSPYPDDTEVIVCRPFDREIVSEWRCYVRKTLIGKPIVDLRSYSGNPFAVPSEDYIMEVFHRNILEYPTAYTIDVGVLEGGENVVIEYNDMWAIGNYGMPNDDYFSLLKARYFEIIRETK